MCGKDLLEMRVTCDSSASMCIIEHLSVQSCGRTWFSWKRKCGGFIAVYSEGKRLDGLHLWLAILEDIVLP